MKKNFLNASGFLLFTSLLFFGCQKQINEPAETTDQQTEFQRGRNDRDENKCRLVYFDWPTAASWQFHYNDKGLADLWTIDYGGGSPLQTNEITYGKNNRLVKCIENYFGSVYEYQFYYSGDRLTRLTRTNVDFPDDATDFRYTYNKKGQNTRQDDDIHDQYVIMYYDVLGNCTKTDVYLGTDLWFSDNYTFNAPVKNPRNNIPGIETAFPFYGTGGLADKRLFTSNRTVIYDTDGTPFVFNDYDPSQTVIQTGNHNLPISASYFDRISQSSLTITFSYDNCGKSNGNVHDGGNYRNNQRTTSSSRDNIKNQVERIFHGSAKDAKEKISALRKQLRKQKM